MKLLTLLNPAVNIAELALVCAPTDMLLLRQDAVYLASRTDIDWPCQQIIALDSDLTVRHVTPIPAINAISDDEWVHLTATASQVILWR